MENRLTEGSTQSAWQGGPLIVAPEAPEELALLKAVVGGLSIFDRCQCAGCSWEIECTRIEEDTILLLHIKLKATHLAASIDQ